MESFDVITLFTFVDLHARFFLHGLGGELSDQEHDNTQMNQLNTHLFSSPLETGDVSSG